MIVVTGQLAPIEKLERIEIEAFGRSHTIRVEGVRPFVLEQLEYYATGAASCVYEADGATAEIIAKYSGPAAGITEVPQDTISLKTSELGKSLYLNKRYAGLPPSSVTAIRALVEDRVPYADALLIIQIDVSIYNPALVPLAKELYTWLQRGTDSYQDCVRTITRVRTVSQKFNTKVNQDDVEKLFTADQLSAALSGSTLPFTVPVLTLSAEEAALGLLPRWRKMMCDVDDTAGGLRQLTEAWQLAKWTPHYDSKA